MKSDRGLLQINRDYYELAASTGGDFYFWAQGEFASARLQVPIHREDVLLAYGAIEARKVFEIPIESSVREMTLFAGIQRKDLALLIRPDGTVARDGEAGMAIQLFQHMLIATITAPAAGVWRLELDGAGTYAVTAHVKPGDDAPDFDDLQFIEPRCQFSLTGGAGEVELALLSKDGSLISKTAMARGDDGLYVGRCTLPKTPFRAVVRGVDAQGARFQRSESQLRSPSSNHHSPAQH